jgi:hypothetical protein
MKRQRHIRGGNPALMLDDGRRTASQELRAAALSGHYPFVLVNYLPTICLNPRLLSRLDLL